MKVIRFSDAAEFHHPETLLRRVRIYGNPQLIGIKNMSIGLAVMGPGVRVPLHKHDQSEEIMFIIHGEGKFFTKDKEYPVGPYTLVYAPAGEEHGFENTSTCQTLEFLFVYSPPGGEEPIFKNFIKVKEFTYKE